MMGHLMPDIPRIYTAAAEWMACMLFIVSLKKRFEWWKSGLIMAGMLCFSGGNRKCADLFLDSVYDRRSISDGRVHLFLL